MRGLLLLALASSLAVAVPTVAAQGTGSLELTLLVPTVPIKPEIGSPAFPVEVTASCDAVMARVSPSAPNEPVQARLEFLVANGVVITGPAMVALDPAACVAGSAGTVTGVTALQITIPRTAPGLQASPGTAKAFLDPVGPTAQALQAQPVDFTVTADYYSLNQVKLDAKLKQCKPGGQAIYEVEVINLGNARTQYTFEVGAQPGGKWDIQVPPTLVVASATTGGPSSGKVTLEVSCTGLNSEGSFQVVVRPAAFDDTDKQGDPLTVNLLARSRGAIPVPGVGPGPLFVLALVGAALLTRRR